VNKYLNINGKDYLTIKEASEVLDEGYSTTHKKLNKFRILKIGNMLLIDNDSLIEYKKWKNKYKKEQVK